MFSKPTDIFEAILTDISGDGAVLDDATPVTRQRRRGAARRDGNSGGGAMVR
jgi:hypothetical protein